ncbi:hypothetical protein AVEN_31924-1 [Araneus ventricosus]|uniref:Uncharacterized protein n=1 Tax=Araneus ventricosus TaxID=182803 RepID=A0A4Y2M1R3_ARAVE|nr:hypothetical protein AVEN_31924-1 [Araneus ventricosus]
MRIHSPHLMELINRHVDEKAVEKFRRRDLHHPVHTKESCFFLHILSFSVSFHKRGRGGLVIRSRPRDCRADSTGDPQCMVPVARQIIRSGQTSSLWCGAEVWRGNLRSATSNTLLRRVAHEKVEQEHFILGRDDLVVRSQLRSQRAPDSKPGSAEESPCIRAWYSLNLPSWVKYPSIGVVRKFGEGVSAQV